MWGANEGESVSTAAQIEHREQAGPGSSPVLSSHRQIIDHPYRTDDGHVPGRPGPDRSSPPRCGRSPTTFGGFDLQAWATTAFLITSTISTPLYGKLSDIYGRKPFFLFAIAVFIVGSALCGLSQNMYELAAFRALQGIGAGGLLSLALAIIGDIVPPRERAKYQGYFLAVFGTASVLGPVLGGFFAGTDAILGISGWRWIFYLNVPIAAGRDGR